jgi:histidine decarboxylase
MDRLQDRLARLRNDVASCLGYPASAAFDYTPLLPFLRYPINNFGDPFGPGANCVNTHEFEREVIQTFAGLVGATADETWGYVTSGGTEGNTFGLFLGRETFPDGIAFYSTDAHASITKALTLLRIRGVRVRSRADGSIDLDDFRDTVSTNRGTPAIVLANVGSMMKGAVDNLPEMLAILDELGVRRFVHADAALSGMILPFVDESPPWNFRAGVDSVAISGHKMIGSPIPCGVVLTRRPHAERVAYATLTGSRNGVTPLFLWHALRTVDFRNIVRSCLDIAEYAVDRIPGAWRHLHSPVVVFDRPPADVVRKWQLAVQGEIAHLVAMPQVTRELIDRFVSDLAGDNRF